MTVMNRPQPQLYIRYKEVAIPHYVIPGSNRQHVKHLILPSLPFIFWPNGKPCIAVNIYLMQKAQESTGNSAMTYASELSHIVRFCGHHETAFEALTDACLWTFSYQLQTELSRYHATEWARNNNTVRRILGKTITFLFWYQKHLLLPAHTPLISTSEQSPQIRVKEVFNRHSRKNYFYHASMPPSESTEPKGVLPITVIEDIERAIEQLSRLDNVKEATLRRYDGNRDLLKAELEYIRARRRFMVWIMKRTGLRLSEMTSISLADHVNILKTKTLIIPTRKRRKFIAPKRAFPITLKGAGTVKRYLLARDKFVIFLKQQDKRYQDVQQLFLTRTGTVIENNSIKKDFNRLVKVAGYKETKACLSMFRHRFITYEVIAHLKAFISNHEKSRQMMTDSDYRSILKRVATKTGHGSVDSLWHYIDLAWNELDIWGNVDRALKRLHATDDLYSELLDLRHELNVNPSLTAAQVIDQVTERLSKILIDAKQAMNNE